VIQRGVEEAVLTERELSISGDIAYEIGKYTEKFRSKGKVQSEIKGKYLIVFQTNS